MESMSDVMQKLVEKMLYVVEVPCPECEGEMHAWREPKGREPRSAPVCMSCGYKSRMKSEAKETNELYLDSLKSKCINYLKYQSVVSDKSLFKSRLDNFETNDKDTTNAKQIANIVVSKILRNEPVHALYTGKTGTGKSHISMAILWELVERSGYKKHCLFISYSELLEQIKFSMNDRNLQKEIMGTLMNEIKAADVVVVDDLGSEVGMLSGEDAAVTDFNIRTLNNLVDARSNKPLIVTTNLTGKQMTNMYGERIVSRLLANSDGLVVKMHETKDKRLAGV